MLGAESAKETLELRVDSYPLQPHRSSLSIRIQGRMDGRPLDTCELADPGSALFDATIPLVGPTHRCDDCRDECQQQPALDDFGF